MKAFCKTLAHWGGVPPQAYPEGAIYPEGDLSYSARFGSKKKGREHLEECDWADAGNEDYSAVMKILNKKYQSILSEQLADHNNDMTMHPRWRLIHQTWLFLMDLNAEKKGDVIEILLACSEHSGAKYLGLDMNCFYRLRLCGLYSFQDTTTPFILRLLGFDLHTGKASITWENTKFQLWYSGPNNVFEPFAQALHRMRQAAAKRPTP